MTRCRFGYPVRPGSKIVFFCDDEATDTFTQLVPNSGGCMINVPVCDAHAEHLVVLAREELLSVKIEQIRLDTEVETYDIRTVGGEHVTTVVREVTRVIEHEHTDAECGHRVYDLEMEGATACSHCGEYYGNTRWCPHRCQVTHDEIVASVIEAEKNGDAPVFADETRQDEETPDDRMPDWEGNTPWIP